MARCKVCGASLEEVFRFCPWFSAPQRRKLVEFFRGHGSEHDRALRVSRYLTDDPQVRFSVWDESGVATAAISLDEEEARRLASFLSRPVALSFRERIASALAGRS